MNQTSTSWRAKALKIIKKRKETHAQVAERLPYGVANLSHKLSGLRTSTIDDIKGIAKAIHTPFLELIAADPSVILKRSERELMSSIRKLPAAQKEKMLQIAKSFLAESSQLH